MYIALAARPLPKWFHLILSILLFNLSCACVYVYIMTRNITTSTEQFESIPSYVVAALFFASGCLSLSMTKSVINENLRVAQVGVTISLVTIIISLAAVVCTLWLADVQDKFVVCVYNVQHSQCLCRNDNATDSNDNWYSYENIGGCNRLDSVNRCMIASIALDAVGCFICFLAFSNFGLIWVRKETERRNSTISNTQTARNRSLNRDVGALSLGVANSNIQTGAASPLPSPVIAPGAHSDWDGWLFSHPLFRQMFSEFRHIWFPPSYDESQQASTNHNTAAQLATRRSNAPPRPCLPTEDRSSDQNEAIDVHCTSNMSFIDYPPPPYSKAPRRPRRREPKRISQAASSLQIARASTSNLDRESRLPDVFTRTTQSCV